jgi:hypothetical protein
MTDRSRRDDRGGREDDARPCNSERFREQRLVGRKAPHENPEQLLTSRALLVGALDHGQRQRPLRVHGDRRDRTSEVAQQRRRHVIAQ